MLDNSSTHKGEPVEQLLLRHRRLRIEHFPSYAPQLNPDEGVWSLAKREPANSCPNDVDELMDGILSSIEAIRNSPAKLRGCIVQSKVPFAARYSEGNAAVPFQNIRAHVVRRQLRNSAHRICVALWYAVPSPERTHMRAISAVDAVSLAIQRTREFLFRPFKWGTFLKLGLVAIVTEGLGSNVHSGSHTNHPSGNGPNVYSPFSLRPDLRPELIAAIAVAVLVAIVVSIVIFYLITRLRFAFFHCLIHNTKMIRPGWWLYGAQAMRFFWLNVVVGFCFLLLVVLVAIPFAAGFVRLFHQIQQNGHPGIGLVLGLLLPLIPVILLLALAGVVTDLILRDCMLPHFALEDATAGEAWAEVWARIKAEKRQFFVYALLRVVLPTIAAIGLFIVLIIPGLALAGAYGAFEYGLHSAFADATGSAAVAGFLIQVFFGVVAFGFALLVSICLGGPLSTGVREYALLFYGGRYQALGDILYPPPAPAFVPQSGR